MARRHHEVYQDPRDFEEARRRGYEPRDIRLRPFVWVAIFIVVGALVGHLALFSLFNAIRGYQERADAAPPAIARATIVPPEPRLQVSPPRDWAEMRERQEAQLNGYGWVDQGQGRVHIPITRAMELIIARGELAVRENYQAFEDQVDLDGGQDLESEGGQRPGEIEGATPEAR